MSKKAIAAVIGVGHSKVYRRADEPLGKLVVDAARAAIKDAGLEPGDIDGITTSPLHPAEGGPTIDGLQHISTGYLSHALGLVPAYTDEGFYLVIQPFVQAINAVAAGTSKYCLVYRALHNPDGRYGRHDPKNVSGFQQYSLPYGFTAPAMAGLLLQRYMWAFDGTREQLGKFVVRNRDNALKWEHGYWYNHRPEPLTLDDYMESRMISEPLCIHDCDMPVQGAAAMILASPERALDAPHKPAYILGAANSPTAYAMHMGAGESLEEYLDIGKYLADRMYRNAGITPADVDVANLYDGFSMLTPLWAEVLGLCPPGEGLPWVADPNIPLNTSSGNLGTGRMHGMPHLMDSALQVSGRAGERQVEGAEIAVATMAFCFNGGGVVFASQPS